MIGMPNPLRERLAELTEEYERGTLRKAYAMAEAVRRGLMPPLHSSARSKENFGDSPRRGLM